MNRLLIILSILQITASTLLDSIAEGIQPRKVTVITTQGNRFKGLVLKVTDTTLVLYPGKSKDLKHGKFQKPVVFDRNKVQSVQFGNRKSLQPLQTISGSSTFTNTLQTK